MLLTLVAALLGGCLTGCATVAYYGQAVKGHWQISTAKQDIRGLLRDPALSPELKQRLKTVQSIRRFAIDELALPDSGSYTDYVDLKRDVTLWLLSAAPAYSLEPRKWCYLLVGCFNYRGYFSRAQADAAAARLAARGWDVVLAPGLAYSTLGFANDPVLSTMLRYTDQQLAGVLFHELAHERLYLRNDSTFNESFASAVEAIGKSRWAAANGLGSDPGSESSAADRRASNNDRRLAFDQLIVNFRSQLQQLYNSGQDDASLDDEKAAIFDAFAEQHQALKTRWAGVSPIDHWFDGDGPNNARLALYSTYELQVPAFLEIFRQCDENIQCFYRRAEALANSDPAARRGTLQRLTEQMDARGAEGQ